MGLKKAIRVAPPPPLEVKKKRVKKVKVPPPKRLMNLPKLTPKVINAIDEYFKNGGNANKAAVEAGYSGPQVFGREEVQLEINRRRNRLSKKFEVTEDRVIEELAKVAFGGIGDLLEVQEDGSAFLNLNDLTSDQRDCITEFSSDTSFVGGKIKGKSDKPVMKVTKQRIKFASKMVALESLARIMGMNQDKTTIKLETDEGVIAALNAGRKRASLISKKAIDAEFEVIE